MQWAPCSRPHQVQQQNRLQVYPFDQTSAINLARSCGSAPPFLHAVEIIQISNVCMVSRRLAVHIHSARRLPGGWHCIPRRLFERYRNRVYILTQVHANVGYNFLQTGFVVSVLHVHCTHSVRHCPDPIYLLLLHMLPVERILQQQRLLMKKSRHARQCHNSYNLYSQSTSLPGAR